MCCIVPKEAHIFVLSMREVGDAGSRKQKTFTHSHTQPFGLTDFPAFGHSKTQTL
jgi:hypothetical protein